jgi:hypothetical protein
VLKLFMEELSGCRLAAHQLLRVDQETHSEQGKD